jgi:3-hydroxyisobutyrate dehydrogenase-like beta-hydroxyacid dehydrogenase
MHKTDDAQTISVIGVGEMGGALVRAFLCGGHRVTVWNRSPSKCAPYVQAGAALARTLEEAVGASDVVVTCVADYDVLCATIWRSDVAPLLVRKTLIQFTSRTPAQAREGAAMAAQWGIRYLEGAIFAYPPAVGTPEGSFVISGAQDVFESAKPVLESLGGYLVHAGEEIGSAPALELGVVGTFVPGAVVAFLQGAALATAEGASLDAFLSLVERHAYPKLALALMKMGVPMMKSGDYRYRGEGAPVGVWLGGLELACTATEFAGVNATFANAVTDQLRQAVAQGHGQSEIPVIFKLMCKA